MFEKENQYIYCNCNPVNATDATGRKSRKNKEKDADALIRRCLNWIAHSNQIVLVNMFIKNNFTLGTYAKVSLC